jgi:excisionase family DNA binding protein
MHVNVKVFLSSEVEMIASLDMKTQTDEVFLTVNEGAALIRMSPATLQRWLRDGKLEGCKIGHRRLIRKSDLLKLIVEDRSTRGA